MMAVAIVLPVALSKVEDASASKPVYKGGIPQNVSDFEQILQSSFVKTVDNFSAAMTIATNVAGCGFGIAGETISAEVPPVSKAIDVVTDMGTAGLDILNEWTKAFVDAYLDTSLSRAEKKQRLDDARQGMATTLAIYAFDAGLPGNFGTILDCIQAGIDIDYVVNQLGLPANPPSSSDTPQPKPPDQANLKQGCLDANGQLTTDCGSSGSSGSSEPPTGSSGTNKPKTQKKQKVSNPTGNTGLPNCTVDQDIYDPCSGKHFCSKGGTWTGVVCKFPAGQGPGAYKPTKQKSTSKTPVTNPVTKKQPTKNTSKPVSKSPTTTCGPGTHLVNGSCQPNFVTLGPCPPNCVKHAAFLGAATTPTETTYTVISGDNLSSIAAAHGLTWESLYAANQDTIGSTPNLIYSGMQLSLPKAA